MRFYMWKDILDINICCHLQRSVWKSFVKLKVDYWLHTLKFFFNPLLYIHNLSVSHHSWRAWWCLAVQFPHSSSSLFAEVGSMKFYRLDNSKVLAWLSYKVCSYQKMIYCTLMCLNHYNRSDLPCWNFRAPHTLQDCDMFNDAYISFFKDIAWWKFWICCFYREADFNAAL